MTDIPQPSPQGVPQNDLRLEQVEVPVEMTAQLATALSTSMRPRVVEWLRIIHALPQQYRIHGYMLLTAGVSDGLHYGAKLGAQAMSSAMGLSLPLVASVMPGVRKNNESLGEFADAIYSRIAQEEMQKADPTFTVDRFEDEIRALYKGISGQDLDTEGV